MDCDTARRALSAMLDGENPAGPGEPATAHLRACRACTGWYAAAARLREHTRGTDAEPPDLTARILAAGRAASALPDAAENRAADLLAAGRHRILRLAVGIAAGVQLALAVPALLAAAGLGDFTAVHTSREMASFDIAVAVGFLLAALRPERARAFVPVAVVLAACLLFSSSLDVAQGMTVLADETGHMVACVQAGLLWLLGRTAPRPRRPAAA